MSDFYSNTSSGLDDRMRASGPLIEESEEMEASHELPPRQSMTRNQSGSSRNALSASLPAPRAASSRLVVGHNHPSARSMRLPAGGSPNDILLTPTRNSPRSTSFMQSLRSPSSMFPRNTQPISAKASLLANKLARYSVRTGGTVPDLTVELDDLASRVGTVSSVPRRYNPGDFALVVGRPASFAVAVNKFGFPPGEGETPEEQQGPYMYILATVKTIHFEEIALYYTVTRCDNGNEQRADGALMEPIRTRGLVAAQRAAAGNGNKQNHANHQDVEETSKVVDVVLTFISFLALPFLLLYVCLEYLTMSWLVPAMRRSFNFFKAQAYLILNGQEPCVCRLRLTAVNLFVACSLWYMFIDQVRLAFAPPDADKPLAAISFVVWMLLVMELLFEVFVRPEGYRCLIRGDKAYAPTTVRYIDTFHLTVETLSLMLFIPEFLCIWQGESCSKSYNFSFYNALVIGTTGPNIKQSFYGHAYVALTRLRVFGLVRHWRNMWLSTAFTIKRPGKGGYFAAMLSNNNKTSRSRSQKMVVQEVSEDKVKEYTLTNASNIGLALMVTNSFRALIILCCITGLLPVFMSLSSTFINPLAADMTNQLQATNLIANETSTNMCVFLQDSVKSWTMSVSTPHYHDTKQDYTEPFLLTLELQPYRCGFNATEYANYLACSQYLFNSTTTGDDEWTVEYHELCNAWAALQSETTVPGIAAVRDIREGSIFSSTFSNENITLSNEGNVNRVEYSVAARFDLSKFVKTAAMSSFFLQLYLLFSVLGGLCSLRHDAEILVLGPLRRMLKIVARYASNPLAPPKLPQSSITKQKGSRAAAASSSKTDDSITDTDSDSDDDDDDDAGLGSYETERLITAVARITDLLRKCWGVAGADIISTNLATREGVLEVFNPTVPGKSVYALFAFAAINGFDHALRNLGGDIMVLINDVANVLHGEVFRWGFEDFGECNKNLGGAFLMVFRIGLVEEVIEKLEQAQDVIFSTKNASVKNASGRKPSAVVNSKRKAQAEPQRDSAKAMGLSLKSLPGIAQFTDRAVIGMLKSYAGIYRDEKILNWNNDFRLGAGVGAFRASLIYGMDAGWAVEGAVGSEYKIDATYLSPHVNMASRMMSACKQYGVTILLSQAVQELMSDAARAKLRHLDTVTVKGSSVRQRIFTYDCKDKGVDFFLYERAAEQADIEAERYSPNIWVTDQDLKAMRQHVTEDFLKQFSDGHKAYLAGDWPTAITLLERANNTMFETAVEEGYLEDEFNALQIYAGQDFTKAADDLKRENGDGPSIYLINYMKSYGGKAPEGWEGWHPLTRK